jgi:hypothetical protein
VRNVEKKSTDQDLRELCKELDTVAGVKKEESGMDWTCSKNRSVKDS